MGRIMGTRLAGGWPAVSRAFVRSIT